MALFQSGIVIPSMTDLVPPRVKAEIEGPMMDAADSELIGIPNDEDPNWHLKLPKDGVLKSRRGASTLAHEWATKMTEGVSN